jgi:hypothetical protein
VRSGRITEEVAQTRSSNPEELRKLIEMPMGEAEIARAA